MKAWRALETGKKTGTEVLEPRRLTQMLVTPRPERLGYIRFAFERGMSVREVARLTGMDPWFLHQIREITLAQQAIAQTTPETISAEQLRQLKRLGLSDERIATEWKLEGHDGVKQVRELREAQGHQAGLQAGGHLRRRVRIDDAVPLLDLRRRGRGAADRQAEDHHSRLGTESHRAGHRVRLLLLPRGVRAEGRRLRDHHGQLQS